MARPREIGATFADDFRAEPYWWEASPLDVSPPADLPKRADAVVIGAGYTGLHAALRIARAGRHVVVLDAGAAGQGCSTRNGGQVSTSIKPGLAELTRRHGAETARRILADGRASLDFTERFIEAEGIACGWKRVGRFHAAHSARAFEDLVRAARNQPEGFETPVAIVPRAEQRAEIGSDLYHGGVVFEAHGALDPGRYHRGLLERVRSAGAEVMPFTRATGIGRRDGGLEVATERGRVLARDVVLATNGYTGAVSPWHRRRIIPIGSYIIATEALPRTFVDEIIPRGRIVSDTRRVVYYYRASPDRSRILFGGRVSAAETDPRVSAPRLHAELLRLFPRLRGTKVSHSWMGFVGYTFDNLAHAGERDGVHYAMGYCGSGVGMAGYLGMKTGLRVLGHDDASTGIGATAFPTRPFYEGRPWFLSASVAYYRARDRLGT
jgi:glycine/D-amino acid oxidase-like deaminating enzyme